MLLLLKNISYEKAHIDIAKFIKDYTRKDEKFRHEYNMPEFVQTAEKRRKRFGMMWDNIIKALENDYSK